MTRTRFTLSDLGGSLSWAALLHFTRHLNHTSELVRELYPEHRLRFEWMAGEHTAAIMADLIDCVNLSRWEFALANTPKGKSKPRRFDPYPRPGVKPQGKSEKVIGSDPIPVSQFDEWWESKETKTE